MILLQCNLPEFHDNSLTWKYLKIADITRPFGNDSPHFQLSFGDNFSRKKISPWKWQKKPWISTTKLFAAREVPKTYGISLRILTNFRNFEGTSPWHVFLGKLWMALANFSRVFSKIIQWFFQRSHSIPYFKDKHIRRTIFYQLWYSKFQIISQKQPKQPKQPISLVFASHGRLASAFAATAAPRAGTWLVLGSILGWGAYLS